MYKYFRMWLYLSILFVVFTGCTGNLGEETQSITDAPDNTPTFTIEPTATQPPTKTPTPTSLPDLSRLTTNCVEVLDQFPEDADFSGFIATFEVEIGDFLFDPKLEERIFIGSGLGYMAVSPDQTLIGFFDVKVMKLIIVDNQGKQFGFYPIEEGMLMAEWIGNEHILWFRREFNPATPVPNVVPFEYSTAVVIDVFTGERIEYELDYPEFSKHTISPGAGWRTVMYGAYDRLVIHPSFDYLLYPTANGLWTGDLVLWDVNAEREISRLFGIYTHTTVPKWSPGGDYFVSAAKPYTFDYTDRLWFDSPIGMEDGLLYWGGFELIRMNLDGEKERLTYVTTTGPSDFFHYTWSPDGKRIAAWLNINSTDDGGPFGGRLVVLDIETGELMDYCIRGHYRIFWSPDGNYVVISKTEDETYRAYHTNVAIVNLRDGWAVRLSDEWSEAAGWMAGEP